MSDADNLRDRIKRLVDETDDGDSAARAVIDEFGLTVETRPDWVAIESEWRNCPCCSDRVPLMSRIVGKWEAK